MKIKTITCHEVYNHGASLQEYALLKYLESLGHDSETIHYKPHYLSNHFNFWRISNPRFEKNIFLKAIYLIIKFPERYKMLGRKRNFDAFSKKYIKSTQKLYKNNDELKSDIPEADAYICGSDQIWNSFFENGKDPSFYLDFVPDNKLKISYAASFAIDQLEDSIKPFVKEKVSRLNAISVRESSGLKILEELNIKSAKQVLDPVFLLNHDNWLKLMAEYKHVKPYIFVYDFDSNPLIKKMANKLKNDHNWDIITVNSNINYADNNFHLEGPDIFLNLVYNASFVISNSFHAVAFSIIFKKDFVVFNRLYKINTRMRDMLNSIDLLDLLMTDEKMIDVHQINSINYSNSENKLNKLITSSKEFLTTALKND
ncbi:polysaccharide pyruvyl transferase family protein [Seonamhaeicola algicola]|uniref:Polysaccharide pyruvyl transferase family protein n=1 Tax=Seonamhaeicola algicola TaxID=1719036 RepID=A0A5C7ASJ9_9FLAO|nr:polysaccharide pyruvyl transferase family protein [Seonamhaeicola algicola]TXE11660.1 polysaccharide pyruvyl transferase family protein [Seonamhaeicola algicola]